MAMQYQGSVTIGSTPIFVTSADISLTREPIVPDLVWGSGWNVNYASGHFDPTFSVSFPWFSTYGPAFVASCIGENTSGTGPRDSFQTATLFNGGVSVFYPNVKCGSFSLSANAMANEAVTCSASYSGKGEPTVSSTNPGPNTPPANNLGNTPVPSYSMVTNAIVGSTSIPSTIITDFSLEVSNNIFKLWTLSGSETPTDLQLGLIKVSGRLTYYSAGISTVPTQEYGSLTIVGGGLNLSMANLLFTSDQNSISGPNNKPMRALGFSAQGTASTPPIVSS